MPNDNGWGVIRWSSGTQSKGRIDMNAPMVRMAMRQLRERLWTWFIWHLPRSVIYRSAIRLIAAATTGEYSDVSVPELTAMDAVRAWET